MKTPMKKQLAGFGCFRGSCRSNLAEMGPDLLFAETFMVAGSMDASVEVVVIVAYVHRNP